MQLLICVLSTIVAFLMTKAITIKIISQINFTKTKCFSMSPLFLAGHLPCLLTPNPAIRHNEPDGNWKVDERVLIFGLSHQTWPMLLARGS